MTTFSIVPNFNVLENSSLSYRAVFPYRVAELALHRAEETFNASVVPAVTSATQTFIRRVFHPVLADAGLSKVKFHSLRHVANSLLRSSDQIGFNEAAQRLGHASPRMTMELYTHVLRRIKKAR